MSQERPDFDTGRTPGKAEADAEILRLRAQQLAREPEPPEQEGSALEVIEFGLAGERYALEVAFVREVHPLEDLTPLPCTPAFVRGLVNVRGRILPVIDLKKFFDLPESGITDLHRILLIATPVMTFGLLADTVAGTCRIPLDRLEDSLPTLTGIRAEYLKGVTAERLVVLDAARMLADDRLVVHETVDG